MIVLCVGVNVGVGSDIGAGVGVGVGPPSAISLPCGFAGGDERGFAGGDERWGVMWWQGSLWAGPALAPLVVAPPDGEFLCGDVVSSDHGGCHEGVMWGWVGWFEVGRVVSGVAFGRSGNEVSAL